jgi:hypothetical protein
MNILTIRASGTVEGMPITSTNPFKGRHFPGEVIVQAIRWYLQYPLAYEHVSQLMGLYQRSCNQPQKIKTSS